MLKIFKTLLIVSPIACASNSYAVTTFDPCNPKVEAELRSFKSVPAKDDGTNPSRNLEGEWITDTRGLSGPTAQTCKTGDRASVTLTYFCAETKKEVSIPLLQNARVSYSDLEVASVVVSREDYDWLNSRGISDRTDKQSTVDFFIECAAGHVKKG